MKREKINCLNCGKELGEVTHPIEGYLVYVGLRADKNFCNDVCTAAYHREHDNPNIHADLPQNTDIACVVCGTWFQVNGYADRGGERQPMYCTPKCRQKAYRARKKSMGGKGT